MVEKILYLGARLVAALILFQTLYFKFGAAPESVYIFTTVGMEPWGRIGVGVAELIAVILLLLNRNAWLGAGVAHCVTIGANGMHFTVHGIDAQGDGGYIFCLIVVEALFAASVLVALRA